MERGLLYDVPPYRYSSPHALPLVVKPSRGGAEEAPEVARQVSK